MSTYGLYIVGSLEESKLYDLKIILRALSALITSLIVGSDDDTRRLVIATALI